jgi:hypothetical protein
MNPFEPILQRKKWAEVTRSKIRWVRKLRCSRHLVVLHESLNCTNRVNWRPIHINDQWFWIACLTSTIEFFAKPNQYTCNKVVAVHCDIIWELVDKVEPSTIAYYWKHELLSLNIPPHNCSEIISGETPHLLMRLIHRNRNSLSVTKCCHPPRDGASKEEIISRAIYGSPQSPDRPGLSSWISDIYRI